MEAPSSHPGIEGASVIEPSAEPTRHGEASSELIAPDDQSVFPTIRRRYLSTIIDVFVVFFVCLLVGLLFRGEDSRAAFVRVSAILAVLIFYEPVLTSRLSTIGQRATRIRVRRTATLERISLPRAYLRSLIKLLLGFYSFFSIPFTNFRRALHDLAVDSVVIDAGFTNSSALPRIMTPPNPAEGQPQAAPIVALYSIASIVLAAVIGSPAGGGFVLAKNYTRLGLPALARRSVLWSLLATAGLTVVCLALPPTAKIPAWCFVVPQFLAMYYIARHLQGAAIEAHKAAGGSFCSLWRAAGIGVLTGLGVTLLAILLAAIIGLGVEGNQ